jgi:hypothetical protein
MGSPEKPANKNGATIDKSSFCREYVRMKNTTPLFPGFHMETLRRKPRSTQQKLAVETAALKQKSFSQLGECFGRYIPAGHLRPAASGAHSRRRFYSRENTFWAFFSQTLDPDGGCREVVAKVRAYATLKSMQPPSASPAAYCNARKKLDEGGLQAIFEHTASAMADSGGTGLVGGRRVIVVDGTGVGMPDTPANQAEWPQQSQQKPGCGFPCAHICGCFALDSGALLSYATGSKKSSELGLFRRQWDVFEAGDISLGDKMLCNYYDLAMLKGRGVDSVVTLPGLKRRPVGEAHAVKALGENDLVIKWKKPVWNKKAAYSREEWEALPGELVLRQIRVDVSAAGFRTGSLTIITTLLDPVAYPAEELAELYFRRWDVELFIRHIKTTMGMDVLRCKSPDMVRKEILMHFIAYNCIRRLMDEAARERGIGIRRISFKGALQSVRQWEPCLEQARKNRRERRRVLGQLHEAVARNLVPERPGRSEPRCVKRRPKPYQFLTAPRHKMKETKHRGRKRVRTA